MAEWISILIKFTGRRIVAEAGTKHLTIPFTLWNTAGNLEVFPFGAFTPEAVKTLLWIGIKQFATDEPMRFSRILAEAGIV